METAYLVIGIAFVLLVSIANTVLIVRVIIRLPLNLREDMHDIRNVLHEHELRIESLETAPFRKARD